MCLKPRKYRDTLADFLLPAFLSLCKQFVVSLITVSLTLRLISLSFVQTAD